jgi:hypothetical protein
MHVVKCEDYAKTQGLCDLLKSVKLTHVKKGYPVGLVYATDVT